MTAPNLPAILEPTALERQPEEETRRWAERVLGYVFPPDQSGDRYGLHTITDRWLTKYFGKSANTGDAYSRDLARWIAWCATQNLNPLEARLADADAYIDAMQQTVKPPSPATINRRLSAVSSWYKYLMRNGVTERNPMPPDDRPKVSADSPTIGLSRSEVNAFLCTAANDPIKAVRLRTCALLSLMCDTGARVSEVTGAQLEQLGWERGHRILELHGKGGKIRKRPLTAAAQMHLDTYLESRADADGNLPSAGPVFVTELGNPVTRWYVTKLVRRIARDAGIKSWEKITPHSLRHAFVTLSLDAGASLRDVRDAVGHQSYTTTDRYDRNRGKLERDPAYRLAVYLAEGADDGLED